jgi:hypothetical protein
MEEGEQGRQNRRKEGRKMIKDYFVSLTERYEKLVSHLF